MAFSYVGPAVLGFVQADGVERTAAVNVTLGETLPDLFELSYPHALPEARDAVRVRVSLPGGDAFAGAVDYRAASVLTFVASTRPGVA